MCKSVKRALSLTLALCLIIALSGTVFAAHPVPGNPYATCTSPNRQYIHGSHVGSGGFSSHQIVLNGNPNVMCTKTQQMYYHTQQCRNCSYTFSNTYVYPCRVTHVYCPTEVFEPS